MSLIDDIRAKHEETKTTCPFCNRDPYHWVDVGVGSVPAAVECCELGIEFFQHNDQQLTEVAAKIHSMEAALLAADALADAVKDVSQLFMKGDCIRDRLEDALAAYREATS